MIFTESNQGRPVGVKIIAALNIIGAVWLGFELLVYAMELAAVEGDAEVAAIGGFVAVLFAGLFLIPAVGLLCFKNWARRAMRLLYVFTIPAALVELSQGDLTQLIGIPISIAIIVYLSREHVRNAFKPNAELPSKGFTHEAVTIPVKAQPEPALATNPSGRLF